jgi:ribonuclease P protein component
VVQQGHRSRTPRLDVYWLPNAMGHPRLGVVVPRFRETAVRRNRLRRRLREASRRVVLPRLPPLDLVIRARPAAYESGWRELNGDLAQWLRQLLQ